MSDPKPLKEDELKEKEQKAMLEKKEKAQKEDELKEKEQKAMLEKKEEVQKEEKSVK